ncbi:Uncharacterised protein [Staphylococcus aureus]|nr:Uncharacterised protein [Staphylococcus aureus]
MISIAKMYVDIITYFPVNIGSNKNQHGTLIL